MKINIGYLKWYGSFVNQPLDSIISIIHLYKRHKNSVVICQHLIGVSCFLDTIHWVLNCTSGSVDIHLDHITLLVSISFLRTRWILISTMIIAHLISRAVGGSLILLSCIIDHSYHHPLELNYPQFELCWLVVGNRLVEDIVCMSIRTDILYFELLNLEMTAMGLW